MKRTSFLLLGSLVLLSGMASADGTRYRLTDVGSLGRDSIGTDLNDRGHVVGYAVTADGGWRAFVYRHGQFIDLGTLYGGSSGAEGINNAGQIAGWSGHPGTLRRAAFMYRDGVMTDLGTLGGDTSEAYAINDRGEIVGVSGTVSPDTNRGFVFRGGTMTSVGTLGGTSSNAYAINERGEVTGQSQVTDNLASHAYVYRDGLMTDIGTLGGASSYGTAINDRGQVAGNSEVSGRVHAFLYSGGVMRDLGTLGGGYSTARGINDSGHVVGHADTAASGSIGAAFVFQGGTMFNLNALIDPADPSAPFVTIIDARAINEYDYIVADGIDRRTGQQHAYLLTPDPPPVERMMADLSADVAGVGPDRKLTKSVTLAQTYYSAEDGQAMCAELEYFDAQVRRLVLKNGGQVPHGPKITQEHADDLVGQSVSIQEAVGCALP